MCLKKEKNKLKITMKDYNKIYVLFFNSLFSTKIF